jgi:hypothetical protein
VTYRYGKFKPFFSGIKGNETILGSQKHFFASFLYNCVCFTIYRHAKHFSKPLYKGLDLISPDLLKKFHVVDLHDFTTYWCLRKTRTTHSSAEFGLLKINSSWRFCVHKDWRMCLRVDCVCMKTISAAVVISRRINFWKRKKTAGEIVFMQTQFTRRLIFQSLWRQNLHEEYEESVLCRQTGGVKEITRGF